MIGPSSNNRRRQPSGTPTGGQFSAGAHAEPSMALDDIPEPSAEIMSALETAESAPAAQLWSYVVHRDRDVRIAAATNSQLTGDMIEALCDDEDWQVRWVMANMPYSGIGERLSEDPHPLVREAAGRNWDTPDGVKARIDSDPDVRAYREIMAV